MKLTSTLIYLEGTENMNIDITAEIQYFTSTGTD